MAQQIIVITGANSGIGKETARALAQPGNRIIMVCRSQARGETAKQELQQEAPGATFELFLCDFASQASIRACGMSLRSALPHVDVLVNNAGALFGEKKLTEEGLESTFAVDHMGYVLLTHYLLALIRKGQTKRIVNVSSEAHRFVRELDWDNLQAEKSFSEFQAYGLAKLGNIFFTNKLAEILKPEGITVNSLHPGVVRTGISKGGSKLMKVLMPVMGLFGLSAKQGAGTSVFLASDPSVAGQTGTYFVKKAPKVPADIALDTAVQDRFWQLSLRLGQINVYGRV